MQEIKITRAQTLKEKPDSSTLVFGKSMTDHMFIVDYDAGQGWHDPRIVPYAPLQIDPAAKVLHYAQEIFEGLKAYRTEDGSIQLFRPLDNVRRMNASAERMALPQIPEDLALAGITELVKVEQDWVPHEKDTSLYIRPFMVGLDAALGVHSSHHCQYIVIVCPVGAYYPEGLDPVKIYVEDQDVRAVKGGTGTAKTGGNYAASLRAGDRAEAQGYSQVLWLDGVHRKYIEEVGSMNVMFKVAGKILTPDLNGSVLDGITRRSCIQLLKDWGYEWRSAASPPRSSSRPPRRASWRRPGAPAPPPWCPPSASWPRATRRSPSATTRSALSPSACTTSSPASSGAACPIPTAGS